MMFGAAFLNIGLDSAAGFYFFKATESEEQKGKVLFTLFTIRLFTFIPSLLPAFFSREISSALFGTESYSLIICITLLLIPINLLMSEQSHVYRYYRKPWQYNVITITKSLTNIAFGITLVVVLSYGVLGAMTARLLSSLIVVVGSFFLFTRKKYTYQFSWYWAKRMLSFGFPLIWAGIATWVFNSSDRFFLLHYSNLTEIGWYSIGNTFSQPILLINMAVQMSFGVLFFKTFNEETDEKKPHSRKMAIDSFKLYLVVSISIALFLSVFSIELLKIITTTDYIRGALAVPFMTFSFIAMQAYQTMGPGISLAEKTYHYTWITLLTALVNIGLNFLFIPRYGFVGAAIATLISYLCYWLVKFAISQKYFPIKYKILGITIYYISGFFISCSVPFLNQLLHVHIAFYIKVLLFVSGLLLPILLGLVNGNDLKKMMILFKHRG